jgi:ABC-type sugar transport system substrate-binding protein
MRESQKTPSPHLSIFITLLIYCLPVILLISAFNLPSQSVSLPNNNAILAQGSIPCQIAFDTDREGNREIYVMDPDGSNLKNLTNNEGQDENPVWSPDGKQIAFVSNRKNDKEGGQFIYIMNFDGSDVRQLTKENESQWPDWSPDGKMITYTFKGDIFAVNADGSGEAVNLTNSPVEDSQSVWSPDSRLITWLSGKQGSQNVFVMNADGSNVRQITDNGQVEVVDWVFDGRILTEWGWKGKNEFCNNCVFDLESKQITDAGGKGQLEDYCPFWTNDGIQAGVMSLNNFTGDNEIYIISKEFPDPDGLGAGFVNLTKNKADDRYPDWPALCSNGRVPVIPTPAPVDNKDTGNTVVKDQKAIKLGYAGNDSWNYMRDHDFKKAIDELKISYEPGPVKDLVARGVSAIILDSSAVPADKLADEVKPAIDKGIPVFILDTETNITGAYVVSIDRREYIKATMGWMLEKLGGKGQITYFDHSDGYDDASLIKELLSKYPDIEVVEYQEGDFDPNWVKPQTDDVLKRKPDLKAIWSDGDPELVTQGLEISGLPLERWPLINCAANQARLDFWAQMEKKNPNFDCVAPVNPPGIAYDAAYAAFYLASGEQIDPSALGGPNKNSLFVPMPVIDKGTRQKWAGTMGKDAFYADELMKPEAIKEKWFLEK